MKPNVTPERIDLPYYTKKNINSILFNIIFLMLFSYNSEAQLKKCKAKLQVENNRNSRSVTPRGTQYLLQISNESTLIATYSLYATNINNSCSNNDGSATSNNVNLYVTFSDLDSNPISSITVNSGETKQFLVKMKSPPGTPYKRWNCTQINADSRDCSNYSISTVLHTFVINSNEE